MERAGVEPGAPFGKLLGIAVLLVLWRARVGDGNVRSLVAVGENRACAEQYYLFVGERCCGNRSGREDEGSEGDADDGCGAGGGGAVTHDPTSFSSQSSE